MQEYVVEYFCFYLDVVKKQAVDQFVFTNRAGLGTGSHVQIFLQSGEFIGRWSPEDDLKNCSESLPVRIGMIFEVTEIPGHTLFPIVSRFIRYSATSQY